MVNIDKMQICQNGIPKSSIYEIVKNAQIYLHNRTNNI